MAFSLPSSGIAALVVPAGEVLAVEQRFEAGFDGECPVGLKRRSRQAGLVVKIDVWHRRPAEANGLGRGDRFARDDDRVSVDLRRGRAEVAFGAGDLEAAQLTVFGDEAAAQVFEMECGPVAVDAQPVISRPRVGNVLAIRQCLRGQGESLTHRLLMTRMNVRGVADIRGHGHGRVLRGLRGDALGVAKLGTHALVRRDLHEQKGEIALPPDFSPAADQCREQRLILFAAAGVGFALIPNDAPHGVRNKRIN